MATAMNALQHLLTSPPDLILLDLGLPDIGGFEALRMMRAVSSVPVVVITARDDEADIIRVLDAGADDYVVKPFGPGQIEARIRAILRRSAPGDPATAGLLAVGGLRLDPDGHEATLDDAPLDLSRREFDLLHYLALRAGQVVTRRDLLTHVWRLPYGGADKTVDVHVSWLRISLLVVAASSLVLVSFLIPLALVLRTLAADRAISAATAEAQSMAPLVTTVETSSLRLTVDQVNAETDTPVTIFLPSGTELGQPAPLSPAIRLARNGRSFTAEAPGGEQVLVAVEGLA